MSAVKLRSPRQPRGNMLILVVAVLIGIVMLLLFFGLGFVRLLGTSAEQKTAIEAAALAAARDCTRIVVPTTEVGWVSLSDYVPNGAATVAQDGFPLPVRSINTLIGTARLDLIIADQLNDDIMRELSRMDMADALKAKTKLVNALTNALQPGGQAQDKNGNAVKPYDSAENAYKQNQIRMTGSTTYKANSLQLTLGSLLDGSQTNIPLPEPQNLAPVASDKRVGNNYKSYVNIPVSAGGETTNFVFGGIGDSIKIVDSSRFRTTISGLPYQIPTIVRAQASQIINGDEVVAVACAQPASVFDPLPAPGAMSVSCPDGQLPELNKLKDIRTNAELAKKGTAEGADLFTAVNGDFPVDGGSMMEPIGYPIDSQDSNTKNTAEIWRVGLHDWIRRAGTKARISAVVNAENVAFAPPPTATVKWLVPLVLGGPLVEIGVIPAGVIHIYRWNNDGSIQYQARPLTPLPLYASSNRQMYSETMIAFDNSGIGKQKIMIPGINKEITLSDAFDAYIRDEVRNRGVDEPGKPVPPTPSPGLAYNTYGGKHAGEPLGKPAVALLNMPQDNLIASTNVSISAPYLSLLGYGASGSGRGKGKGHSVVGTVGNDTGIPPFLWPQDDFADGWNTPPPTYIPPLPPGGPMRPTYLTTGTAVDIKFRRQVDASKLVGWPTQYGYIGEVGQQLP